MSNAFATTEDYLAELRRLGELAYSQKPGCLLQERYDAFCAAEAASEAVFPSFGSLCRAFNLGYPEAVCIAVGCYLDASPLPRHTLNALLECCRRLGAHSPEASLSGFFVPAEGGVALHPVASAFLLMREPRLPQGVALEIPHQGGLLHTQVLFEELAALLDAHLADKDPYPLVVALCGKSGSGRSYLISRLCGHIGAALLRVDLRLQPPCADILLAARLYGAAVCLEHTGREEQINPILTGVGFVFALCPVGGAPPASMRYLIFSREMPEPTPEDRQSIASAVFGGPLPETDAASAAELQRLTPGQTKLFALRLKAEIAAGKPCDLRLFRQILLEMRPDEIAGVHRLECAGRLGDLSLPAGLSRRLAELCAFIKLRHTVYGRWGFAEKIPWGRGLSALFYGAPGTGKTMAAAVLANETGLPLLRVDISQLFSKYIGETQKNIGSLFDAAAKADGILFFDEADALFTRRTETADAQDKYANAETAYLLQRIELYNGFCLLATNLLQNFDEAFRRRIDYMLHFPLPDAELREKIWRGVFPAAAPVGELDYGLLARHLELSGASIKNCAVHGAYLAAMNGTAITMEYLLEAAKNEYQKHGKAVNAQISQLLSV